MPITPNLSRAHSCAHSTTAGFKPSLPFDITRSPIIDPRTIALPEKFTRLYPQQEDCILSALAAPTRFISIFAPTASGKTVIYHTISLLRSDRTQIDVHTKYLQNQIAVDFPSTFSITGHRNYCPITQSDTDAEDSLCPLGKRCNYKPIVEAASLSNIIVTNYAHDITIRLSNDPDRLGHRSLLVLDEAHGIHNEVCSRVSVSLPFLRVQKLIALRFPPSTKLSEWIEWSKEALSKCSERLSVLVTRSGYANSPQSSSDIRRLTRLSSSLSTFLSHHETVPYVVKQKDDGSGTNLIPVFAKSFTESALFAGVPKIILTSASIDRRDMLDLGISVDDLTYIEMPSVIPVERRRIYYTPTTPPTSLKYPVSSGVVRLHTRLADEIISARLDRRGLIHTQSYELNERFLEELRSKDLIITHKSLGAREAVERFRALPPPSILASPAVGEGYDFPYELCSYGIILKLPWPNIHGNPELAERCRLDRTYRNRYVVQKMEQMIGRIVRTPTDIGEIFMVDEQWSWFISSGVAGLLFHQYVKDAFVDCSGRDRVLPVPPRLDYNK